MKLKVFEAFSGIGAQHKALTNLKNNNKLDFEIVGASDWYINAIIAYALIHHNEEFYSLKNDLKLSKEELLNELNHLTFSSDSKNPTPLERLKLDVLKNLYIATKVSKNYGSILSLKGEQLPKIDVLTYSFPCQDLSHAGKKAGMSKGSNTRSGLLWEVKRIIEELNDLNKLPQTLLMENVSAIYNQKNKPDLISYLEEIKELGYSSYCFTLNVKNYGVPQSRERAFVISILEEKPAIMFFDKKESENLLNKTHTPTTGTFLNWDENNSNPLYVDEEKLCIPNDTPSRRAMLEGKWIVNNDGIRQQTFKPCTHLNANSTYTQCITTKQDRTPNAGVIPDNNNFFRFLTPRETFLLMGFDNNDFDKVKDNFNKENLYKFSGNSIGVNVLEILFDYIYKNFIK